MQSHNFRFDLRKLATLMEKLIFKKLKLFSESTKFQNDLIRQLDKQKIKSPHHLYETLNLKPIYNALKC